MNCYCASICFIIKRGKHIRIFDGFRDGSLVTVGKRVGALRQMEISNVLFVLFDIS